MNYCKRCAYPENHPLNIIFDEFGVCSGCRVHEEKEFLDWSSRKKKLKNIFEEFQNSSTNNYDCIVPVSGARDSYFIVDTVKNKFGMNPLLVTYNKQYNTDVGIRNLANLRIKFDCDLITLTIDPEKVKSITRSTLRQIGSIYWHCIAGQTVFPVQMAVKLKIPLIVWGCHQGVDQVGMFSHLDEVEMTRKYRKEHDLMGYEAEDLINDYDGITYDDIKEYIYPDDSEIEQVGVRGIYLNNYLRWDSRKQHETMIDKYGYETALQGRTFDNYNDVDCFNYSELHDYIKYLKYGYSKVYDHASREIRWGRMKRDEAVELIEEYQIKKPKSIELFCEWLGISESSLDYLLDQHRNKDTWERDDNWEWKLKYNQIEKIKKDGDDNQRVKQNEKFTDFILTKKKSSQDAEDEYILIGKGVG